MPVTSWMLWTPKVKMAAPSRMMATFLINRLMRMVRADPNIGINPP